MLQLMSGSLLRSFSCSVDDRDDDEEEEEEPFTHSSTVQHRTSRPSAPKATACQEASGRSCCLLQMPQYLP